MATLTEGTRIEDVIRYEGDNNAHGLCRRKITVLKTETVQIGTVLRRDATTADVAEKVPSGQEANANAISIEASAAQAENYEIWAIIIGPAIANYNRLDLEAGVDKAALLKAFEGIGVRLLDEPAKQEVYPG